MMTTRLFFSCNKDANQSELGSPAKLASTLEKLQLFGRNWKLSFESGIGCYVAEFFGNRVLEMPAPLWKLELERVELFDVPDFRDGEKPPAFGEYVDPENSEYWALVYIGSAVYATSTKPGEITARREVFTIRVTGTMLDVAMMFLDQVLYQYLDPVKTAAA